MKNEVFYFSFGCAVSQVEGIKVVSDPFHRVVPNYASALTNGSSAVYKNNDYNRQAVDI